jgi:hypothetical protein
MVGLLSDRVEWLKGLEQTDPMFRGLGVARFIESILALLVLKLQHIVVQDHQLSTHTDFEKFWVSTMSQFTNAKTVQVSEATWEKKLTAMQITHQGKTKAILFAECRELGVQVSESALKPDLVRAYAEALIASERASVQKDFDAMTEIVEKLSSSALAHGDKDNEKSDDEDDDCKFVACSTGWPISVRAVHLANEVAQRIHSFLMNGWGMGFAGGGECMLRDCTEHVCFKVSSKTPKNKKAPLSELASIATHMPTFW